MLSLVTGAGGHLGSRLVRKLLAQGRPVRALLRPGGDLRALQENGALLPGLEVWHGDVLDPASLEGALRGVGRVFHLAGVFDTRLADESGMVRVNIEGTRLLLEALRRAEVGLLVHTSSVAALGYTRHPGLTLDEDSWNQSPIDAYTASKTEGERLVHAAVAQGLRAVVVNPATVIGPGDFKPTPSNAFPLLALRRWAPFTFAGGHTYVDADDVADGHLQAERHGRVGERYVLGGTPLDNSALLRELARRRGGWPPLFKLGHGSVEVLGLGAELAARLLRRRPLFTRAKGHLLLDYYGYFSHAKAARELGYSPRPLAETLDRAEAWYRERGWLQAGKGRAEGPPRGK